MGSKPLTPVNTPCSPTTDPAERSAIAALSLLIVWCIKRSLGCSSNPIRLARLTTWMVKMESPPKPKKLSWMPTRSTCSKSFQMPASCNSCSVRGAQYSVSVKPLIPGAGKAFRSILPLAVRGIFSNSTQINGTIYSGSLPCSHALSAALSTGPFATI